MDHKDVFLCHASEDKAVARSLALGLAQYGITTWLDEAEMHPGDRLVDKLGAAIHQSRWFIILLTHNSVAKSWVQFELSQAIDREVREGTTVVIPVVLYDCEIPHYLRNKIFVDLRDYGNYEYGVQRLAITIKGDVQEVPNGFRWEGVVTMSEAQLLELPRSQTVLELNLRAKRWAARRLSTLSHNSRLLPKQVITYCERSAHIVVSPVINNYGDIYYGHRDRVIKLYKSETEYIEELNRFFVTLRAIPSESHPLDVIEFFFSFHPS